MAKVYQLRPTTPDVELLISGRTKGSWLPSSKWDVEVIRELVEGHHETVMRVTLDGQALWRTTLLSADRNIARLDADSVRDSHLRLLGLAWEHARSHAPAEEAR